MMHVIRCDYTVMSNFIRIINIIRIRNCNPTIALFIISCLTLLKGV